MSRVAVVCNVQWRCCGAGGPRDFVHTTWYNTTNVARASNVDRASNVVGDVIAVPGSCCPPDDVTACQQAAAVLQGHSTVVTGDSIDTDHLEVCAIAMLTKLYCSCLSVMYIVTNVFKSSKQSAVSCCYSRGDPITQSVQTHHFINFVNV